MALILHLDENNSNSWSGEPTTNLVNTNMKSGWTEQLGITVVNTGTELYGADIFDITFPAQNNRTYYPINDTGTHTTAIYVKEHENNTGEINEISLWLRKQGFGTNYAGTYFGYKRVNKNTWTRFEVTGNCLANFMVLLYHPGTTSIVRLYIAFPTCEKKSYATRPCLTTRTSFYDISGNDYDGDVSNMTFTEKQQGLIYSNENSFAVANNSDIEFNGTEPMSWLIWLKKTGTHANYQVIIEKDMDSANQKHLEVTSAGTLRFHINMGADYYCSAGTISDNVWYMCVCTFDGTDMRIYLDAVLKNTTSLGGSSILESTQPLTIGHLRYTSGFYFMGQIPLVKQYNEALSLTEIQKEYNRQRIRYNKPPIEGAYSPNSTPGPLLYEFNCLTDTSLRGEETENLITVNTIVFYTGYHTAVQDGTTMTFTLTSATTILVFRMSEISDINGRTFSYSGTIKKNGVPYNQTNNQFSSYSGTTSIYSINSETGEFYGTRTYSAATAWILHWPVSGDIGDIFTIENFQIEEKAYATPYTPEYRYNWQSLRNLSDKEFYGYFMNSGFTTPPQIDTSDYNGLKLEASSTTVGNFVVLQKPNIITDGLVLHLDAGNKDSYPGTGTTWSDLSKEGNDFTIIGSPTHADDAFTINETQGFDRTSIPTNSTTATFVIFYKTTDTQELWATGQTNAYYIAASNSNNYYHSNAGTPTNYVDLTARTDPTAYKDGNYHMWEAKNVNLSAWTELEFWQFGTLWNMNGTVAIILVYDRALTADESKQNFNALRGRFSI